MKQTKEEQRSLGILMLDHLLLHPLIQLFLNLQYQHACQKLCAAECLCSSLMLQAPIRQPHAALSRSLMLPCEQSAC